MSEEIVVTLGDRMRIAAGENLIKAQERLAKSGTARENILLARFLLRTYKKFDNVIHEICTEGGERDFLNPPDFEIAPEEIAKLTDRPLTTEEKKAVEKMSWGMHCNPEMNEVRIFPMNGNQIIIHGKEEAQFFTDHLLDCFRTG